MQPHEIWSLGGRTKVAELNASGAFESAELLCSFIHHAEQGVASESRASSIEEENDVVLTYRLKAIDCVNFAISFMGKEEYLRALKWFEQALEFEKNFQQVWEGVAAEFAARVENGEEVEIPEVHLFAMKAFFSDEVKLHMMECFFKTQEYLSAIECFEATSAYEKEQQRGDDETMEGIQTAKKYKTEEQCS